jgi:hypothetical protein
MSSRTAIDRPSGDRADAALTCGQGYCDLYPPAVEPDSERIRVVDSWTFANFSSIQVDVGRSRQSRSAPSD